MKKLKKLLGILITISIAAMSAGCAKNNSTADTKTSSNISESLENSTVSLSNIETSEYFSEFDLNTDYNDITAKITLNDDKTEIDGKGAEYQDNKISITSGGTFLLSGSLTDGQIYVNAADENVRLIFDGVNISNSSSSPVFVEDVKNVSVTLTENSENILTDSENYVFSNTEENEPDAVIFSKDDLSINGSGNLTINANYNEGITTKNDLRIAGGNITITSVGNAVKGKDSVAVRNASLNITSGEDGIKSSNIEETDKGYIYLESGTFNITAQNDAIAAENNLTVIDGEYNIKTGDGADSVTTTKQQMPDGNFQKPEMPDNTNGEIEMPQMPEGDFERPEMPTNENGEMEMPQMPEGDFEKPEMPTNENGEIEMPKFRDDGFERPEMPINENGEIEMPEGGFKRFDIQNDENQSLQTSDEETISQKGFKSNSAITINGGKITADCTDDSVHAGGDIQISGGEINLKSGDDGIHSDSNVNIKSGNINIGKSYEGIEGIEINIDGGDINITSSDDGLNASNAAVNSSDPMASSPDCNININGGTLYINADGDGIDSNGSMTINDGKVIVDGSESGGDSPLDTGIDIIINGGTLIAVGSSGMLETPSSDSKQNTIVTALDTTKSSDNSIYLTDENGNEILSHSPVKNYSAIIISSPDIETGKEYNLTTGTELVEKVSISDVITTIGSIAENHFGGRGNNGGMPNGNEFEPRFNDKTSNENAQSQVNNL